MGAISGVVRDPTGDVITNATVTVSNPARGIERRLATNDAGVFTAPALPPAPGYEVRVESPNFTTYQARNIEVNVGQNANLAVKLEVAASTTTVNVVDTAPVISGTQTELSQNVNQRQIDNLPINGRRVDSYVLLTPATTSDGTFGQISFRGVPGNGNTFLTDGNDTTNQYYGENAGRTRILAQISQDAVQEFQVLNAGYSAEYGRASGGIVNTVTRGGTNLVRGTAYWFFRNRTLNARDRYAAFNPPEWRHQAGGSVGGPVIKDRLFFFGNFEYTNRNFPIASSIFQRGVIENGQFLTCGAPATAAQCQAIQPLLSPYFMQTPRNQEQHLAFAKMDWHATDRHTISGSFNFLRFVSPNGIQSGASLTNGAAIGNNGLTTVRDRYARLSWTAVIGPAAVNEFRFGWFKDRQADEIGSYVPSFGAVTLTVAGVANLGIPNYLPRVNPSENRFQFADTLTWTRGKHTLKFGLDISSTEDYINNLLNRFGSYNYGSVTAFAQDFSGGGGRNYQSYSQAFGTPVADFTVRDYAFFAQDEWRILPSVTLNLGVRYDYADLPTPQATNPDYPQTGRIPTDKTNFSPRLGVAYSITPKTAIRAGYGLSYSRYFGGMLTTLLTNNNLTTAQLSIQNNPANPNLAGPVFPNRLPPPSVLPTGLASITFAAPNLKTPYTQNGDIAVDHEVGQGWTVSASYVFTRGVQFFTIRDLNIGAAGPLANYTVDTAGITQRFPSGLPASFVTPTFLAANRVDSRYLRVNEVENGGRLYYDGLSVRLNKRFATGYQASVAYTWAHAIDANVGNGGNVFFSAGPSTLYPGDYRAERGSSPFDQRHRVSISFVAEPRVVRREGAWARYLFNGWQLSAISILGTTTFATPTVQVSGTPIAGAAFSGNINGYGGSNRVPFLSQSSIEVDPVTILDARMSKILNVSDRYRLFLTLEAFNVTNSQYDTSVDTVAFRVAGDRVLHPNPGLGAGVASARFPDGTNARRAQVSARFVF
jgi:outer membrane receptor protein involved in Fe transport